MVATQRQWGKPERPQMPPTVKHQAYAGPSAMDAVARRLLCRDELIRRFTPQEYAHALESWAWLPGGLDGKLPIMTTAFGDVFLHGDSGVWFLDTIEGTLVLRWADQAALQADLTTRETQQDVLMPWLVGAADAAGLLPGATDILSFKHPQVLGGAMTIENVEVSDFVVARNLAGQIHHKVKDLPPGTPVTNFSLE